MQEKELQLTGGSLHYEIRPRNVCVTGWNGLAGEVTVPEKIEGLPVTIIGKKAFLSKKNLRRVFLPDTVEQIEDWAFAYCDSLTQVELPCREIRFGRSVFLECGELKSLAVQGKGRSVAALLAAAVTTAEAYYLLHVTEAGSEEWLERWDARMLTVLGTADQEGYSKQVLCGEEDYGSTDLAAYMSGRRKVKVRLLLLRLLYSDCLKPQIREKAQVYLQSHTKGCESEETWQVLLGEHGDDREYYELFAELGCLTEDNLDALLQDIGEDHPEMKAFFLRYKGEKIGYNDFFEELEL